MSDEGNGTGPGDESASELVDGHDLGGLMMQQLTDLLESWTTVLESVAELGVDPAPLLHTLASTLRATADQLDPPADS